jgi:diguanylate cyclase
LAIIGVASLGSVVKPGPESKPDTQDWRKKYFDSLESLEKEQLQFRTMEAVLKRLTGRLCVASMGQAPKLDDELKKLQIAMRCESTSDELEKLTSSLTDAIGAIDRPATPSTSKTNSGNEQGGFDAKAISNAPADSNSKPSAPNEAQTVRTHSQEIEGETAIRAVLASLIADLRRDPALIVEVDALDASLGQTLTRDRLPQLLSALTDIVARRIHRIENAKQEIEVLLGHMIGKLDEIGRFVVDQNQSQSQSAASSETLNVQLVGEMKAMGESVEAAADLQSIRLQVRSRVDTIGKHLQEFREREAERVNAMRARNEQMQSRVAELEAEANRLHTQLQDEQRLSTQDALTKVPNRLAYEKRIDDEIKRWQRFKQPTCLAVWDVDHFKQVNDTYGHRAGDRVLAAVAESLAGRIRGTDFIARYGGEEFVMLLCGTRIEDALRLIEEMRVGISNLKLHFRGTPIPVAISCGLTAFVASDNAAAAFDRADKALYKAKEAGRNRCIVG